MGRRHVWREGSNLPGEEDEDVARRVLQVDLDHLLDRRLDVVLLRGVTVASDRE